MELSQPVLFSFDYPPLDGGISRLCAEIVAQSSLSQGVDFQVVTGNLPRPWREIQAIRSLYSLAKVPYCICGLWYPEGLIATFVGIRHRVILAHGSELLPTRQRWRRKIWGQLQSWVLRRADLVVANSHYTARLVNEVAPKAKVIALPLAVDPVRFCPGSMADSRKNLSLPLQKFIISSVSRIHRYKGFETVFRAIANLPIQEKENILYVIAGTGPDREMLTRIADELGISAQILWLGFVKDENLTDIYRASDVFVLCTQENSQSREVEGFGLVFLEAQSCGTPVIGTRAGGIPDAISDNQGGWLIPPNDDRELTRHLSGLIRNPSSLSEQRLMARKRVLDSCTWKKYVQDFFSELLRRGVIDA